MFATLSDLIAYLFGIQVSVPIQTFGFFVALAFFFPYFVFVAEFKRKEADGDIKAFTETEVIGLPASVLEVAVNALLGFLLGFKVIAAIMDYRVFAAEPVGYLFSLRGNWVVGLLSALAFGYWIYADRQKARLPKPLTVKKLVHPYQLMGYLVFVLGCWGFVGAKLFDTVEHFELFLYKPLEVLFSPGGFTYYGGLVFGAIAYLVVGYRRGMKLSHLADIGSPGMMLAYGIGRIGCHLSGDGDWGIVNTHAKPDWIPQWAWAFKFPHNVIDAGEPIYGCVTQHCRQLPQGVYPTSFYEAAICLILFGLMWAFRTRIRVAGLMFYLFLILNGTERILIEQIRVTDRHRFLGLVFTQAEFICVLFIIGGLTGIGYLTFTGKLGPQKEAETSR